MTMLKPSVARRSAIAAPMPREAPVTIAILLAMFQSSDAPCGVDCGYCGTCNGPAMRTLQCGDRPISSIGPRHRKEPRDRFIVTPPSSALFDPPSRVPSTVPGVLTAIGLCFALYALPTCRSPTRRSSAPAFTVMWLAISVACSFLVAPRNFVAGSLGGLFALLAGWRIAGLLGSGSSAWPLFPGLHRLVAQFADAVMTDRKRKDGPLLSCSAMAAHGIAHLCRARSGAAFHREAVCRSQALQR